MNAIEPDVIFRKLAAQAVPASGGDMVVVTFRPRAIEGWVLSNCWHDHKGILTAILRKAAGSDASASDHYDL
jgi:hypothetical protein